MKKNSKIKAPYHPIEAPENNIVSEPIATYGNAQDPIATRTIGLMGMQGKRDVGSVKNESDVISVIRS